MKKKIIILALCIITFIGILFFYIYLKQSNRFINKYNLIYNIEENYNSKNIFCSYIAKNLEDNNLISQDLYNYGDVLEENNYINLYNKDINEVKKEVDKFFGIENSKLDKIKLDHISYSYFIKQSSFAYQFDIIDDCFGVTKQSESGLNSIIKVNYYLDENNYSISLFDNNNSELIYMHTDLLTEKSYLDLYNEYLDNYCNSNVKILFGEDANDSALFPMMNIIIDSTINDDIISNYYVGGKIDISGTGTFLGVNNSIDKSNIKYNFTQNSVLFIKRQDCQYPNLIIPCQKD